MKAVRFHKIGDLRYEEAEKPVPEGKEILIRVEACGICGSDIPRVFSLGTRVAPVTLGHEFAGVVEAVGDPGDRDLIGRRAAVFNIHPCHQCDYCKHGDYAHCEQISYLGTRIDGGFAEYCLVPERFNLTLCDNDRVSSEELALTEPASVALHAVRSARLEAGNSLLIVGAGPIGILIARWAALLGVQNIALAEIDTDKIAFARARGFTVIDTAVKPVEEAMNLTRGRGFERVVEGSGSNAGLNFAIQALATFGHLTMMGNPHADTTIRLENHSLLLRKEASVQAIWNSYYSNFPLNEWRYTVDRISDGKLEVKDLITHRVSLEQLPELFEQIHRHETVICKAIYSARV